MITSTTTTTLIISQHADELNTLYKGITIRQSYKHTYTLNMRGEGVESNSPGKPLDLLAFFIKSSPNFLPDLFLNFILWEYFLQIKTSQTHTYI